VVPADPNFLLALAVASHRRMLSRSAGITGQLPGHEVRIGEDFVAVQTDAAGVRTHAPASVRVDGPLFLVQVGGRDYPITFKGHVRDIAMHGEVGGKPFCAQIERRVLPYRVTYEGAQIEVRVLSVRAAELTALMPFKGAAGPVEVPAIADARACWWTWPCRPANRCVPVRSSRSSRP